ncbi:MAG: type transport system ATP-binding protein, partial [Solirubrobacteraceae bacterium]|nr:type transport system ATP-binding protein [Solirubrobacteraceae bacterium]
MSHAADPDAPPIRARGLVKRYGRITAVDHVDLTVSRGDVYGYLGPNGAGKTTSLRMLLGLIRPDEGTAQLFGRDPLVDGVRALDGVAGFVEAPRFYPYLNGRRNLELVAALDGDGAAGRIDEALETVDLVERARDKVGGYSHGMRQRLGIAGALLREPRLLLLDEPATGLDPAGMRDMRALIHRLAAQGMTVLLSSHLMGEVEELCNRVAIISDGSVRYEGSLRELMQTTAGRYDLRTTDDPRAARIAEQQPGIGAVTREDRGLALHADKRAVPALSLALGAAGIGICELVARTATLEELFFRMTEGADALDGSRPAPAE